MKKLITNYTFDASAKTVTLPDYPSAELSSLLLITNVTDNIIIYNFAQVGKGGTVSGDTFTLAYDTTSMADTDELQVFYDDANYTQTVSGTVTANLGTLNGAATSAKQDSQTALLGTVDADTSNISTKIDTIAGAVSGTEMQVDVLTMPTTTVQATNLDIRDLSSASDSVAAAQSGSWSVTANAGTNLNTSTLALETGGNLAAIKAKTDNIPAQGQALSAASLPVVLPAAQITTLTPPAAITGFATAAKQDTLISHVDGLEASAATIAGAVSGTEMQVDVLTMPPVTVDTTGLATDTKQDTGNTSLASIDTKIGEVQASPTSNTLLDRLKQIYTAITGTLTVATHAVTQSGTWTVQPGNTANTTAWKVDGSAVTQPVSGTVGVTGVSTSAKQDTIIGHLDGVETLLATIEANQLPDGHNVTIDNPGDIGGGTQYADGDARGTATGTLLMGDDGTNIQSIKVDSSGELQVDILSSALPTGAATAANQQTDALTDTQLRATAVDVSVSAMPTTNVAQSGSWSVTAEAGTDLNTSALALESGGNLAAIKAKTDNIPAQGQALEAASLPVVLPAAQITTLTPPAAITGFATSAKQDTIIGHVDGLETSAATIAGAVSGTEMQVDVLTMPTTTVQATNLDIRDLSNASDSVAAVQSGTWTVQPGNTANTTAWKVDGSAVTQPISGTVTVTQSTSSSLKAQVQGFTQHDSVDGDNPLKVGGRARSSEITAVASDDRSDFITDLVGKQIVLPYANPENFVSGAITTAMTSTTSTSLIAAPASGLRNYITTIIVSNASSTVGTDVVIQDGSGGTTLMTIPAAATYGGAVINLPVPLRQPTTATAIYCANVTTGASTKVSAVGYKGV